MIYTVQFDLDIDSNEVFTEQDVESIIKDYLDSTGISVKDFKLIEVND